MSKIATTPSEKAKGTLTEPETGPKYSKKFKDGYVTLNEYFILEEGTYKIIDNNLKNKVNTLLIGPTGVGKSEVIMNIALAAGLPITIFDMGTMTDPIMGLVGTHTITVKDGKSFSEFRKSRFSDVIQQPGIVVLDEISRAAAAANNLLFPCLDFRKELSMEYSFDNTAPIKVHEDCVFFATANMGSQYTGTHKLDRALVDRFMVISIDPLKKEQIIQSLSFTHKKLSKAAVEKIVNVYVAINKEHDEFKISFNLSMRHLKNVASLVENKFTIYDAFYTICKGLGGQEGLKAIESIINA